MKNVEIISGDLSKTFSNKTIFKNLSFSISTNQSLTVTGKNGSGKSTLIKVIAGVIGPSKGNLTFREDGIDIPPERRFHKLGLLSPYLNLYDELTGIENLIFFYNLRTPADSDSSEKINSLLNKTGLYGKRNELVKNYSSGMKQKLKLIFAVINEPEILLMDEPRTNLDKEGVELIYEISAEQKKRGILIIATNDEDDKTLCDSILNIEDYK